MLLFAALFLLSGPMFICLVSPLHREVLFRTSMYFFVRFLLFIKKVKDIKKKKKKTTVWCLRFEWGDGERSQVAREENGTF